MRTVDDYCDIAKTRHNIRSDAELARKMNLTHSMVSMWRTKRSWPSDSAMIRLAELANVNEGEALIELNIWKNLDTPAFRPYEALLKIVQKTAAIVALIIMSNIGYVNEKAIAAPILHVEMSVDSLSNLSL